MVAGLCGIKTRNGRAGLPIYNIVPALGGQKWAAEWAYECPMADVNSPAIHAAIDLFSLFRDSLAGIEHVVGKPSNQAIKILTVLKSEVAAFEADALKQE